MKSRTFLSLLLTAALTTLPLLAACGAEDSETDPVKVELRCTKTAADACYELESDCRATRYQQCSECNQTCQSLIMTGYDASCTSTCDSICDTSSCSRSCDSPETCISSAYTATLPAPDPTVLEACQRAAREQEECGGETFSGCEQLARYQRSEAAAVYDCVAKTPCGQATDTCDDVLPASGIAAQFCANTCGITAPWIDCDNAWLADALYFDWWKDSARAAFVGCVQKADCSEALDCVNALISAIAGE